MKKGGLPVSIVQDVVQDVRKERGNRGVNKVRLLCGDKEYEWMMQGEEYDDGGGAVVDGDESQQAFSLFLQELFSHGWPRGLLHGLPHGLHGPELAA
jgi:hypothetical protein